MNEINRTCWGTGDTCIPAVVLAGGKCKPELTSAAGVMNKALVSLAGKPMLSYVLQALSDSNRISDKILVGGPELDSVADGIRRVDDTNDFLGNIKAGAEASGTSGKLLIITSDIPMLKASMIDDFIERTQKTDADFYYPIITKQDNESKFPGMKRTYVTLRDGIFTGGNLIVVDAGFLRNIEPIIGKVFAARKNPFKLASLIGWGLLINLALKRATIQQAESSASRLLEGTLKAIITPFPEIGADVDKPEDIPAAEKFLQG